MPVRSRRAGIVAACRPASAARHVARVAHRRIDVPPHSKSKERCEHNHRARTARCRPMPPSRRSARRRHTARGQTPNKACRLPQRYWAMLVIALAPHAGGARQRDRQRGAADHRAQSACERRRLDLGRQRLSARDHHLAAAARVARRSHRLPAYLSGRADPVHGGVARLRACPLRCRRSRSPAWSRASAPAGIMSVNTALVRMIYPPAQLGRGIAINAMVVAMSSAVGPTVAAGVLAVASWPWLFAINVPIGIAAIVGGFKALPLQCRPRVSVRLSERGHERVRVRSADLRGRRSRSRRAHRLCRRSKRSARS